MVATLGSPPFDGTKSPGCSRGFQHLVVQGTIADRFGRNLAERDPASVDYARTQ